MALLAGRSWLGTHSALRYHVKTRSNSFHSTLEPNTEMFSKVSRSLAQFTLVNSVSTLLNKGGMSCNCPKASQDFFVNQNKQASAQHSASALCSPNTSETLAQSNTHLFKNVSETPLVPIMANSNMSCMPKPCHKHAKVHADVCSGKNTCQSQERQIEGTQKKTYFHSCLRGHYAVTTVTTRSLRSQRSHYAVTRGHCA